MYDGIKIECVLSDRKKWNKEVSMIGRHLEETGEIVPLPSEAQIYGCTFSRQKIQGKTKYAFQGSLHKFYNRGGENDDNYTIRNVQDTLSELRDKYGINPEQSKIVNFEFGVNVKLPTGTDAQVFQKYLVSAYTKAFEKLNPKRPMVGYIAEFNEFGIKIYDKGYQAQTGATDQLRIEIKINRTRWLDQFNFQKGSELFLSDLLNPINIKILGDILEEKIRSLILTPREIDTKKLSPKQRLTFYECRDARSWEEWTSKQRERKRAQLKKIFQTLNQPDPVDVLARLVSAKWIELTTVRRDLKEEKQPQKVTISTLIVSGIRVIMNLFKRTAKGTQTKLYIVCLPRGIPLSRPREPSPLKGFRRWIDLNMRAPPVFEIK